MEIEHGLAELYQSVIEHGRALGTIITDSVGNQHFILPEGFKRDTVDLETYSERPKRKRATVSILETDSFIHYVKAFQQAETTIFCDRASAIFTAIFDYHGTGPGEQLWGQHRASLKLQRTPEWATWMRANKQPFTQAGFVEFLEDQTPWIQSPPAADLLEIAMQLEETGKMMFKSTTRLQDGSRGFTFQDERATTVKIPEIFELLMAPYDGAPSTLIRARLRYRTDANGLKFFYSLINPEIVERAAINRALDEIEAETGLTALIGTVEKMGL